jgi:hypothetical protein
MASAFSAGVYSLDTFSTKSPTSAQQQAQAAAAQDIAGAGLGMLVLASFHASAEGDISFNDTWVMKGRQSTGLLNPQLPSLLAEIAQSGATILVSFGGGGTFLPPGHEHEQPNAIGYWDFLNIAGLIQQYPDPADNPFFQSLSALFQAYPAISGLDIDLESYTEYESFTSTLVTLIKWLNAKSKLATIVPYDDPQFWTGVLEQCVVNSQQQVAWVNLQNAPNGTLSLFMPVLQGANIGWSNVPAQVFAGAQTDVVVTPSQVQDTFQGVGQAQSGLRGGWLWTYENGAGTPLSQYAQAIEQGLAGNSAAAAAPHAAAAAV